MQNYSYSLKNGSRTSTTYSRPPTPPVSTVTNGVIKRTVDFTVTNGTGGDPNHRLATSMSFKKVQKTYGDATMTSGAGGYPYSIVTGASFGSAMLPDPFYKPSSDLTFNALYNRCLDTLGNEIRGDLDLMIDLAEWKQSQKMLAQFYAPGSLERWSTLTRRLHRNVIQLHNFVRGFSPRRWADRWLEYQYGWRPLVSSIYNTAAEMVTPPKAGYVRYRIKKKEIRQTTRVGVDAGTSVKHQWTTWLSKRVELQIEMSMLADTVTQLSRISSLNPASIAWELTPYSFVADWLLNIGQYLRNLENGLIYDQSFLSGFRTDTYLKLDDGVKFGYEITGPTTSTIYGGCQQIDREVWKSRTRLTSYPMPRYPTVKLQMGASRITSGAALLSQFLRRS